jgi:hypothetical protein
LGSAVLNYLKTLSYFIDQALNSSFQSEEELLFTFIAYWEQVQVVTQLLFWIIRYSVIGYLLHLSHVFTLASSR